MRDRWFDRKLRSFVTLEMATLKGGSKGALAVTVSRTGGRSLTGICVGRDCSRAMDAFNRRDLDTFDTLDMVWLSCNEVPRIHQGFLAGGGMSVRSTLGSSRDQAAGRKSVR